MRNREYPAYEGKDEGERLIVTAGVSGVAQRAAANTRKLTAATTARITTRSMVPNRREVYGLRCGRCSRSLTLTPP